jgi:basic amino acid/polyamine antiporter, APA family
MSQQLPRSLSLGDCVWLGLGSILGTGVFVSLAIARTLTGVGMLMAILLAGGLALCNGLSAARLAASHPVSGGTYEYGYRYLGPYRGFFAGWLFLLAKSASAATAALGVGAYLGGGPGLALLLVLGITALAAGGLQRSSRTNQVLVSLTLLSLGFLIGAYLVRMGISPSPWLAGEKFTWFWPQSWRATAMIFVAYTGYGRIATLGEEVHDPARTIPRAIAWTCGLTTLLYLLVALVLLGHDWKLSSHPAPLAQILALHLGTVGAVAVSLGATTAMAGVLLNLILGLSRTLLAMARRGDMPVGLAQLNRAQTSPVRAVWAVGGAVACIILVSGGEISQTWSFSALTVLLYYGLTNWAALKLPPESGGKLIPGLGLGGCLGLVPWIEGPILLAALVLLVLGLLWKWGQTFSREAPH